MRKQAAFGKLNAKSNEGLYRIEDMNTHLILGIFIINRRIERGWDFEEKWPIHAQGPTKPVFGCALGVEGADVLFNNIDCI